MLLSHSSKGRAGLMTTRGGSSGRAHVDWMQKLSATDSFVVPRASGPISLPRNEPQARVFGWIRYKTVGQLIRTLDYALIVMASTVSGIAYHAIILRGGVPDLLPYASAGNIVAVLFVFGAASQGAYAPNMILSTRLQVRSILVFWTLAFLSLALFLFLAKIGSDFSRGSIMIFGLLGPSLLLVSHSLYFHQPKHRRGAGNARWGSSNCHRRLQVNDGPFACDHSSEGRRSGNQALSVAASCRIRLCGLY